MLILNHPEVFKLMDKFALINPYTGEPISFDKYADLNQYCKINQLKEEWVRIKPTDDPDQIFFERVRIVDKNLLTYKDLRDDAALNLWFQVQAYNKTTFKSVMKHPLMKYTCRMIGASPTCAILTAFR